MKVTFWGTRGSIPAALTAAAVRDKIAVALIRAAGRNLTTPDEARDFVEHELGFAESATYGGNSSCVQIETGGPEHLICDMGSGARELAVQMMARHAGAPQTYHVLMSHLHWDHIMGFPFFLPAYVPGNRIRIYGCHAALEQAFRRQNTAPSFPVEFESLRATIEFVTLAPDRTHEICGFTVTPIKQHHGGGDSYGYRLERDGKAVVYSTDSEHKLDDPAGLERFVKFLYDADLVIFDAMYSLADAVSVKEDWGHSSNVVGLELCQLAHVRHLVLFHHEPVYDDHRIHQVFQETIRLEEITRQDHAVKISAAYDGLVIDV